MGESVQMDVTPGLLYVLYNIICPIRETAVDDAQGNIDRRMAAPYGDSE